MGQILTNEGATGNVFFVVQAGPASVIPVGARYRFRVKTAQSLIVDPVPGVSFLGGGDGKYLSCNQVGAEMDFVFLGSNKWVPEIKSGTWTVFRFRIN